MEDAILNMGYDSITHIGGGRYNKNDDRRHRVYIVFDKEQIKSADPVTYDNNGNVIPLSERFKNEKGRKVQVNQDIVNLIDRIPIKQSAIVQAGELLEAGKQGASTPARHKHDWLDDNGKNDWDTWTVYIQEKNSTVWEATLHVANTSYGEKILYNINPIKMVEGSGRTDANTTTDIKSQPAQDVKEEFSFSPTADSEGNTLSKAQQEYFKNSFSNLSELDAEIDRIQNNIITLQNEIWDAQKNVENNEQVQEAKKAMWAAEDTGEGVIGARINYKRLKKDIYSQMYPDLNADKLQEWSSEIGQLKQMRKDFVEVKPITEEEYDKLVKHFGTTSDFGVAGFILKDGRVLDFSGKKQYVSKRIDLSQAERLNQRPNIDRDDAIVSNNAVLFFKNSKEYDPETASLREQLINASDELNKMDVVKSKNVGNVSFKNKKDAKEWVNNELSSFNGKVDRQNFGVILFSKTDIDYAIEHLHDKHQQIAISMMPYVLKRGIKIGEHNDHKERGKHTVTFGAPIEINGTRGNMAVTVNVHGSHAYATRVLLPDGSAFVLPDIEKTPQGMHQGVLKNESLADGRVAK